MASLKSNQDNFKDKSTKFLTQAISGAFISEYRVRKDISVPQILFIHYLNDCWHLYGKKEDAFIYESLNSILKENIIKGVVCLFYWFASIGSQIIKIIVENGDDKIFKEKLEKEKLEIARTGIQARIKEVMQPLLQTNKMIGCQGQFCDNKYNGEDLFSGPGIGRQN